MMPESSVALWTAIPAYLLYGLCCALVYLFVLSFSVILKQARAFFDYKFKDGASEAVRSLVTVSKAPLSVGEENSEAAKLLLVVLFSLFLPFLTYITFEGELRFLPILLSFVCCTLSIKFLGRCIVRPLSVLLFYSLAVLLLFIKIFISLLYKIAPNNGLDDNQKKQ